MRLAFSLCAALVAGSLLAGCGRGTPPPAAPATRWTAGDSAYLAESLVPKAAGDAWAGALRDRNGGQRPSVRIGEIRDDSGDQVPVDAVRAALAAQVTRSDRIVLAETGGDAVLSGLIRIDASTQPPQWSVDLRLSVPTDGTEHGPWSLDWTIGAK